MDNIEKYQLLYFRVTDVWRRFCEKHSELLDLTFEEYSLLLSSKIENLEELLQVKNQTVQEISHLEEIRSSIIDELNQLLRSESKEAVSSISELVSTMSLFENENGQNHLFRFNEILIDIIQKIQKQNKKNQVFLNKAIHSLREIREETMGIKSYSTYNNKGMSSKSLG